MYYMEIMSSYRKVFKQMKNTELNISTVIIMTQLSNCFYFDTFRKNCAEI